MSKKQSESTLFEHMIDLNAVIAIGTNDKKDLIENSIEEIEVIVKSSNGKSYKTFIHDFETGNETLYNNETEEIVHCIEVDK